LSVLCTLSTTLLGVVATPLLIGRRFDGLSVDVGTPMGVLESIGKMVLIPVVGGSVLSSRFPEIIDGLRPFLPTLGVLSTLVLVAGGSSNSVLAMRNASSLSSHSLFSHLFPSCLLALGGAALALGTTTLWNLEETAKRTIVVETLSKSPTLAYLLAVKHLGHDVSRIPGGAMVTLAGIGAGVASVWSGFPTSETRTTTTPTAKE
jgi:BASS family bile acid:Na+ symporter